MHNEPFIGSILEINLKEFKGYKAMTIYEFLIIQEKSWYKINIPKTKAAFKDTNFDFCWELSLIAYAGHKLYEISEDFSYNVPSEYRKQPYVFEIFTNDKKKLSDLLFLLLNIFIEPYNHKIIKPFHKLATQFCRDAYGTPLEPATWGLVALASKYLE